MNLTQLSDCLLPRHAIAAAHAIELRAGISVWAEEAQIRAATTWQIQQLRRVARLWRSLPWRDSIVRGHELDGITRRVLRSRGAWTDAVEEVARG